MIKYDRPLIIYIPIYLSIRSLGVKVVVLFKKKCVQRCYWTSCTTGWQHIAFT